MQIEARELGLVHVFLLSITRQRDQEDVIELGLPADGLGHLVGAVRGQPGHHHLRRHEALGEGQAGFPVGLLLANFAFLISVPLGEQWAWRVPFLLSAVLIVVGIFIRLKVEESPEFEELKEEGDLSKNPLKEVIRDDWRNILRAFCLRIAETAGYAVSVTFMLSYISSEKLADRTKTVT